MPQAYRALDLFRFLAAMLVAWGHFNLDFRLGLADLSPIMARFGLFVDFFFILSGFVIALNYSGRVRDHTSYGAYLWRRVARLWPLHVLVLVAFGALGFVGHLAHYRFSYPEVFALSGLPWNLALMHAWGPVWHLSFNVASWSISAEMFVYILFPLFALLARRLPMGLNLALMAGFVVCMTLAREAAGLRPWHEATYDLGALRAVPSFFLGVLIHRAVLTGIGRGRIGWPGALGALALMLAMMHGGLPAEAVILGFGAFVWCAALAEARSGTGLLGGNITRQLGDLSYGLYMVHMPLMTAMLFVIRRTTGFEGPWPWLFAWLTFALSLAAAVLAWRFFEKPIRDRMNTLSPFERRKTPRLTAAE